MTADQIAAVSAIAALLTAAATLLTILELRRQRLTLHRPELIVEDLRFTLFRTGLNDDRPLVAVGLDGAPPRDSSSWRSKLPFSIANVGRGVARDITAAWSFDIQAFAELLAPYEASTGGNVWIEGRFVQFEGDGASLQWAARSEVVTRLGTLLPMPEGRTKPLELDAVYGQLIAAYFAAACDPRNNGLMNDWYVPPLFIDMSYRDLTGKAYRKRLAVSPILEVLAPHGFGEQQEEWFPIGNGRMAITDA